MPDPTGDNGGAVTAIAHHLLNNRAVELRRPDITPAQVRKFIEYIESCLRSGSYNPTMFTNLIDPPAMEAIDVFMSTSVMLRDYPVAQWQTDWDVDSIWDALREIYPLNESERFVNSEERWEAALKSLKHIKVDNANLAQFRKE